MKRQTASALLSMPAGAIEATIGPGDVACAALLSMPAGAIEATETEQQQGGKEHFQCQLVRLRHGRSCSRLTVTAAFNASWCD